MPSLGAIKFENQAQFNPCKYASGLVNAMVGDKSKINSNMQMIKNVQIYENTKVVDVKQKGKSYEVITEDGKSINSKYVILATHYPIINIPGYYFLKMYQSLSYVIAVETKKALFQGMYINAEKPTLSFRVAGEGEKRLLVIAGMDNKTGEEKDLSKNYEELIKVANQIKIKRQRSKRGKFS